MSAQPRDAFEVLDWIVSRHVHAYLDTAGRPIGEGRSDAFQDVQTEMRTCPYSGSRYRHAKPMNASAIQEMPAWPELLTMMGWLGQRYRMRHGREVANSDDLARVTSAGIMLVDFLALRRRNPLQSGEIPLLASGIYKVCLGYQLPYLPERFSDEAAPADLPDAEGFLTYVEESGLLIGEAEVCSCPPAMILQSYEAMRSGQAVLHDSLPPSCAGLEIAWDEFDVFADNAGEMWRELVMYAMGMPAFLPELADPQLPPDVRERLNAALTVHGTELLEAQEGLVVELARGAQAAMGSPAPVLPRSAGDGASLPEPGSVADAVLAWLSEAAPSDMRAYAPLAARALQAQMGGYEEFETGVLARLNLLLSRVMNALGFESGAPLTPSALARICGRTLRDWGSAPGAATP